MHEDRDSDDVESGTLSQPGRTGPTDSPPVPRPDHEPSSRSSSVSEVASSQPQSTQNGQNKQREEEGREGEMQNADLTTSREGSAGVAASSGRLLNSCDKIEPARRQFPHKIVLVNRVAEKACIMDELLGYLGHETYKSETAIPKITEKLMRRIIEWCEHGQNNGFDTMHWSNPVMEWTDNFSSANWDTVLKLIGAADYPDISSRLRAGHATAAQRITGKAPKQICAAFEFEKDLLSNLDPSVPQSEIDWWTSHLSSPPGTYWPTPSPTDAYRIRQLLQYVPLGSGHTVPAEIAHQIVSLACTPRLVERRRQKKEHLESSDLNILASSGEINHVWAMYLCTQSIPYPSSEAQIPRMFPVRATVTVRVRNDTWDDTSECDPWVGVSILRPLVPGLKEKSEGLEDVVGGRWMDEHDAKTALMERGWEFIESEDWGLSWGLCNIGGRSGKDYSEYKFDMEQNFGPEFLEVMEPGCCVVLWSFIAGKKNWGEEPHADGISGATVEIEFEVCDRVKITKKCRYATFVVSPGSDSDDFL